MQMHTEVELVAIMKSLEMLELPDGSIYLGHGHGDRRPPLHMVHLQRSDAPFQPESAFMEARTCDLHRMDNQHLRACRMGCSKRSRLPPDTGATVELKNYIFYAVFSIFGTHYCIWHR